MNLFQRKILGWTMKHLFNGISKDDIILIQKGDTHDIASQRGLEIPNERMLQLKKEAEYLENSFFWKEVCDKGIRYTAQEKGMAGARIDGDLYLAQGMIFDLDIIKQAIKEIQNFKIREIK